MSHEVTITELGRSGDGLGEIDGVPRFIPFALPGERVSVGGEGKRLELAEVLKPSRDRIEPICGHFRRCGGCQLQHYASEPYHAWKSSLLRDALDRAGIEATIEPMVSLGAHLRRRAIFTANKNSGELQFGFLERASNRIVDLSQCPVLLPELESRLGGLRELANWFAMAKSAIKIAVLVCENGIDVAISGKQRPKEGVLQKAISKVGESGFARLSFNGEILIEITKPYLRIGRAQIIPPPENFAQAVESAELIMADLVLGHLKQCKHTADLFSGMGAFSLRLAERATVLAAEMDAPALQTLERAWRETGGRLKAVRTERRDLFRRPLMAKELKPFDGVVLDPPRIGAEAQSRQLAASPVRKIAAVSCNPVTLARDLSILMAGGYRLVSLTPIDQFVFTPHLETIALLER